MTKTEISDALIDAFAAALTDPAIQERLSGITVSTLGEEDDNVPDDRLQEPCLLVLLCEALPDGVSLPETFEGYAVRSLNDITFFEYSDASRFEH